jgi:ABC-type branched-subunit amino acid transport system permease subunit
MWARLKHLAKPQQLFSRLAASDLCQRDIPVANTWEAIGWWETRRVPYNLIVGSTGIVSCIVVGVVAAGSYFLFDSDFGMPDPPLFAIFAVLLYGIAANVCFTGGWLAELVIRKAWPNQADRFSTLSFSFGLIFSVLLTLTPAIVIGAGGLFALARHSLRVIHQG